MKSSYEMAQDDLKDIEVKYDVVERSKRPLFENNKSLGTNSRVDTEGETLDDIVGELHKRLENSYSYEWLHRGGEKLGDGLCTEGFLEGIKEDEGKTAYSELDWDYIDAMADRMSKNRHKYPPKNWQKKMDIVKLAESAMRHARKILQTIDDDIETAEEHATALGCNGMMLYFNLKNQK